MANLAIYWVLAWRNLWRNHRRTLIMLAAIVVGVWAMIFMTAVLRGMVDQMIEDGLHLLPGHAQIHHPDYRKDPSVVNSIEPPGGALLDALGTAPVVSWTTRIKVPAVVSSERDTRGVRLVGIDPGEDKRFTNLAASISEGRFLEGPADKGIVVGRKLVDRLETGLGKRIVLMSQDPDNEIADRGFRIVGIYSAKLPGTEEAYAYVGRDTLQQMLKMGSQVSEIAILGADYRDVEPLMQALQGQVPGSLELKDWHGLDALLSTYLGVMDGFVLVWIVVIFLALSFGLVNTLVMAVFERVREIGLMLALGMRPAAILIQIMLESAMLVLLGLALGNLLAVVTIRPLQSGIDISGVAQGMEMMGVGSVLYPRLYLSDMIMASAIVIVLGLLTSLLPAWRASQYQPVEALTKT